MKCHRYLDQKSAKIKTSVVAQRQQGSNPRTPNVDIYPFKPSPPQIYRTEQSGDNAPTHRHSSDLFAAIQSRVFFSMPNACRNLAARFSRCAIRAAAASDGLLLDSKRVAAFSRNWRFHCESCAAVMLWRRQSSAEVSTFGSTRLSLYLPPPS